MNIQTTLISLALLANAAFAGAQNEQVLGVVQVQNAGSPVVVTGQITVKDQPSQIPRFGFESDVQMTNMSAKDILLMVVTLDVVSALPMSLNYPNERDYFFESRMLQPRSSAELRRVLGRFGEPARKEDFEIQAKPLARAKVVFVQFSDGSTWGDGAGAERVLGNRVLSLKQLEVLREDYSRLSEEEFLKELLGPTLLQPIFSLQELYHEKRDLTPVLAKLDDMLENARVHSTTLGQNGASGRNSGNPNTSQAWRSGLAGSVSR